MVSARVSVTELIVRMLFKDTLNILKERWLIFVNGGEKPWRWAESGQRRDPTDSRLPAGRTDRVVQP